MKGRLLVYYTRIFNQMLQERYAMVVCICIVALFNKQTNPIYMIVKRWIDYKKRMTKLSHS